MAETETPNSNKMTVPSCCSLVQVRLGKHERQILLANSEAWTVCEEWNRIRYPRALRKAHAPFSRAISRLVRLKLIEDTTSQVRIPEDHEANTQLIKRRDKDGFEWTYPRRYIQMRYQRLTPLGAAVVDQFRDVLASSKRIRWSRFDPPPAPPPPPEPPPQPPKPTKEQRELKFLKQLLNHIDRVEHGELPDPIDEHVAQVKAEAKKAVEEIDIWAAETRIEARQNNAKHRARVAEPLPRLRRRSTSSSPESTVFRCLAK
jgi:hypothetical protein